MVTHCYQAAWSPTWAFPLPGIQWGRQASVTQYEHTVAIVCPALWCHSAFTSNTDSQWEDAERRKLGSGVNSGLCHRLVTIIHANPKHTIQRGVQKTDSIKHPGHSVMTALDTNTQSVKHTHPTHTQTHTHLGAVWGNGTCAHRHGANLWSVYF